MRYPEIIVQVKRKGHARIHRPFVWVGVPFKVPTVRVFLAVCPRALNLDGCLGIDMSRHSETGHSLLARRTNPDKFDFAGRKRAVSTRNPREAGGGGRGVRHLRDTASQRLHRSLVILLSNIDNPDDGKQQPLTEAHGSKSRGFLVFGAYLWFQIV
jgi:hypothetical protein